MGVRWGVGWPRQELGLYWYEEFQYVEPQETWSHREVCTVTGSLHPEDAEVAS